MGTARLISIGKASLGRRYVVGPNSTIGRSPECDIALVDAAISRVHAHLLYDGAGWRIADAGSRNGVLVNGTRIVQPHLLASNDCISVGPALLLFEPDFEILPADADAGMAIVGSDSRTLTTCEPHTLEAFADRPSFLQELMDPIATVVAAAGGETWEAVLTAIRLSFGFRTVSLLTLDDDRLETVAVSPAGSRAVIPAGSLSRAKQGEVALVGDGLIEPVQLAVSSAPEPSGAITLPLQRLGRVVGLLHCTTAAGFQPEARQRDLADSASLSAVALTLTRQAQASNRLVAKTDASASSRILGRSAAIQQVLEFIDKAGEVRSSVLIRGETGTGKELIARALHDRTLAAGNAPFVAVNCGAIPEHLAESEFFGYERGAFSGAEKRKCGFLELATGGTLFLDEVGELPPSLQVKLLRALEQKEFYRLGGVKPITVTIRLISATHRDLVALAREGKFREDLLYRINVLSVESPPLRGRPEDVGLLFHEFLTRFCAEFSKPVPRVDDSVLNALCAYGWPGNIRELRNVAERIAVLCTSNLLSLASLPAEIIRPAPAVEAVDASLPLVEYLAQAERARIAEALTLSLNSKASAARLLGISRPTLDKKIRDYGITFDGKAR